MKVCPVIGGQKWRFHFLVAIIIEIYNRNGDNNIYIYICKIEMAIIIITLIIICIEVLGVSLGCQKSSFRVWTLRLAIFRGLIGAAFKTSIKTEWKLFILVRNPCAILVRPQWELARGQFFKLSLRDLARR